ncbi:MAG: ferrichrome ABC transporter [Clostridiales bacterium]|nr:MAG: ferrichrome ABC transporter [Clostridiales bacterium]
MTSTLPKSMRNKKNIVIIIILFVLAIITFIMSIGVGVINFTPGEVVSALISNQATDARLVIIGLRLPRALVAALVGICLSLSGCILQGIMRNHLASPSTIGVTSGATFVGYMTLVVFSEYYWLLPIGTIVGSFLTTMLIYTLAYNRGVKPLIMILAGLAVSALFGAFNDVVKVFYEEEIQNVQGFLVGGLNGTTWQQFKLILPFAILGVFFCFFITEKINILLLGDETARSLGLAVDGFRFQLIAVSSLLAGAAVAVVGLVNFVGLIIPHIARLLVGSDYKYLLPASALLSVVCLTLCDMVGRIIIAPAEMPVGIILSFIGAPFFLFLLRKQSKEIH